MAENIVEQVQALVVLSQEPIDILLANIETQGKDVVLSPELSKQIALFKQLQKHMDEAETQLKEAIKDAMAAYGSKSLKGQYTTISVSGGRSDKKYVLQDGFKQEWGTQKVSYEPNVEKIEEYIGKHGTPPDGVTVMEPRPSVTIRLK